MIKNIDCEEMILTLLKGDIETLDVLLRKNEYLKFLLDKMKEKTNEETYKKNIINITKLIHQTILKCPINSNSEMLSYFVIDLVRVWIEKEVIPNI
jgi:hypothetical protein